MPRLLSAKRVARANPPPQFIPKVSTAVKGPAQPPSNPEARKTNRQKWVERTEETNSAKIFRKAQEAMEEGRAHFRVGERQVYFPHAKVVLLRPSAKHTPYQAKFIVPRYFNKLDLRDYLWHVYGLRALNVTTQLLWSTWTREMPGKPRKRTPQVKKMTIEMPEPFVWPEPVTEEEAKTEFRVEIADELKKYAEDIDRQGSDKFKPPRAFGGIVGPYQPAPSPFIPKNLRRQLENQKASAEKAASVQSDIELVKKYLGKD